MASYVLLDGTGDYVSTPDAAAFSALDDFSVLCAVSLADWTPGTVQSLISHLLTTGNQRSWRFFVNTDGKLNLDLSALGTTSVSHPSTVAPTITDTTELWVLVTRAKTSGDVLFYTAPYTGSVTPPAIGAFTQLGTTVNNAMTSTLFDSTTTLQVGVHSGGTAPMTGKNYRSLLYTGIYGGTPTLVRDMNASDWTSGTTWVSATTGETWTLQGDAVVHNADLAGHGDIASGNTSELLASLDLSGHGDAATGNTSEVLAALNLAGHGDAAATGSAEAFLGADLAGHGDQAATGTAELLITADLSGHGDIADGSTADVSTTRCARPDADDDTALWTIAPLFSKIDEETPDDSDEITSDATTDVFGSVTSVAKLSLSPMIDPLDSVDHTIRIRAKATLVLGAAPVSLKVELRQSGTLIATRTLSNLITTSYQTFERTLTSAEADAITDYSALALWINGSFSGGKTGSVQVSWAEFCLGVTTVVLAGQGDNASTGSAELLLALDLSGHGDNVATGLAALLLAAYMDGMGAIADGSEGDLTVTTAGGGGAVAVLNRYQLGKRRAVANRSRGIRS